MAKRFDVIVVGAGPAGATAAYILSSKGFKVLLIERGRGAGSKQVFGGKVYAQPLRDVWPDLDKEAPIHRWVVRERISLVSGDRVATLEYYTGARKAFTTYLPELTKWMVDRAVASGAVFVDEVKVDEIVVRDGKVVGVRSGGEVVESNVVIDAEGVNRVLLEKLNLAPPPDPKYLGLGVKEVIRVDKSDIETRLGLGPDEGLAWVIMGDVLKGLPGGGFIYTMKDAYSIGVVVNVGGSLKLAEGGRLTEHISRVVEGIRLHPYFNRLWGDSDVVEYGARLVVEGGMRLVPRKLCASGLIVVGEAAGLLINTGYTVRGVDVAVTTAKLAAETVIKASERGDFSEESLRDYVKALKDSYVCREALRHKGVVDAILDAFFTDKLPRALVRLMAELYEADYEEPTLYEAVKRALSSEGINMVRAMIKIFSLARKV